MNNADRDEDESAAWAALQAEAAAHGLTVEQAAFWWLLQQHCNTLTIRLAAGSQNLRS